MTKHQNATDACAQLVALAEQRWREEEGSYRDDITCIVAFLPFLDPTRDAGKKLADGVESIELDISSTGEPASPSPQQKGWFGGFGQEAPKEEEEGDNFVRRRLSVAEPLGEEELKSLGA